MKSIFAHEIYHRDDEPQYKVTQQINQAIQDGTFKADNVVSIVHHKLIQGTTVIVYYKAGK